MRILYVTTIGITVSFFKNIILRLIKEGNIVDIACNDSEFQVSDYFLNLGCHVYSLDCSRKLIEKGNINAIKQLKQICREKEYDYVHCHTPIAAFCTRLACRKIDSKVIYTAHGFHFYQGAPFKNWVLFYPAELVCSLWTDILITINKEDYYIAQKMYAKETKYIPGVGIDVNKFANIKIDVSNKRKEIGVDNDAYMLFSVGELNANKNHEIVIRALAKIGNKKINYVIAGEGNLEKYLLNLSKELGISEQIHLIGYRNDIEEILKVADVFIHPSFREGLPVSVMEAMASGLPCIVSNIRGNQDLIDLEGGAFINPFDEETVIKEISNILDSDLKRLGKHNAEKAKQYDFGLINDKMIDIYQ